MSDVAPARRPGTGGSAFPVRTAAFYLGACLLTAIVCAVAVESSRGVLVVAALAVVLGLGTLLWTRPDSLLWLVVLGYAVQPDLKFFVSAEFGPAKDVIAVGAILVLAVHAADANWRRGLDVNSWVIAGVLAVIALYVIDVGGSHGAEWRSAVRPVIEAFGLFLAGYTLLRDDGAWRLCVRVMLVMGIVEAVTGLFEFAVGQAFLAREFAFPYNLVLTTVGSLPRSFGTQLDPFNYGAMIALVLPFALFAIRRPQMQVLCVALLLAGLAAGLLRTSAIIVAALVLLALVHRRANASAAFLAAAVVLGVVGYVVVSAGSGPKPSTAATLNGRTAEWSRVEHAHVLIAGAGVGELGSGANRTMQGSIVAVPKQGSAALAQTDQFTAASTSIDSSFLALVADVGLPGLLLVLAVFARIVVTGLQATRVGSRAGPVLVGMMIVVVVDGITRSSLTQFPFGDIALFAIGVTLAAAERGLTDARWRERAPDDLFLGYADPVRARS